MLPDFMTTATITLSHCLLNDYILDKPQLPELVKLA